VHFLKDIKKCLFAVRSVHSAQIWSKAHLHPRRRYSLFGITTGWWSRISTRRVLVATIQTRHFVMGYYAQQRRPISLLRGGASFRRRPLLGLMRRARFYYAHDASVHDRHATTAENLQWNWKMHLMFKDAEFR